MTPTERHKHMAEILDRAMALLRQGWIRGRMKDTVDGVECYCASGAVLQATPMKETMAEEDLQFYYQTLDLLDATLEQMPVRSSSIMRFNDREAKDVDDVLEVFRKAKERLVGS